jgi:hypothetical protein
MPQLALRVPLLLLAAAALAGACSNKSQASARTNTAPLVLVADTNVLPPDTDHARPRVDLSRFGVERPASYYRLSTPKQTPFRFDVVGIAPEARGTVGVRAAHAADDGRRPVGGVESLAAAGFAPAGAGLLGDGVWLLANGEGMARLTLQGSIERPQLLVVADGSGHTALVEIVLGEASAINPAEPDLPADPTLQERVPFYSSDAWTFGMPTVAISGDRTSVVAYEGDRESGMLPVRYELRMQHDRSTGARTGGGSLAVGGDAGNWRDHEIAALHNVLAVARNEAQQVRVLLSFDRGATFGQELELPAIGQTRLAQVALAADYSLAVSYWQEGPLGELEFVLAQGGPVAFDPSGSPVWFTCQEPRVLRAMPQFSTPLTTGMAYSSGGDLVVGYAASWFTSEGMNWTSSTEFRCAVQPFGGEIRDTQVDLEEVFGRDPSVALLGSGPTLQIAYAYEVGAGIRVATSADAGLTFAQLDTFGGSGAHLPSVFLRQGPAGVQADVLFLAAAACGTELHHARWTDFPGCVREDFRVTQATMTPTPVQPGRPIWNGGHTPPLTFGWRIQQVSWLGYDATLDGDQIVVAVDEVTFDAAFCCYGANFGAPSGRFEVNSQAAQNSGQGSAPPLAPGMSEPLPPVDPAHAHQLALLRLQ